MAKVLVLYYSSYGHVENLAHEIAAGAREAGGSADEKRVPELLSPEAGQGSQLQARPERLRRVRRDPS